MDALSDEAFDKEMANIIDEHAKVYKDWTVEERQKAYEVLEEGYYQGVHLPMIAYGVNPEQRSRIASGRPWAMTDLQKALEHPKEVEQPEDLQNINKMANDVDSSFILEAPKIAYDLFRSASGALEDDPESAEELEELNKTLGGQAVKVGIPSALSGIAQTLMIPARTVEGALTGAGYALREQQAKTPLVSTPKMTVGGAGSGQGGS